MTPAMESVTAFAPATVSNVACGFDVLGFALGAPGDEVSARFGGRAPLDTLLACAFEGERVGAGSAHGDNIAPCLYGGFVLVRRTAPPDIVRLPVPDGLTAVVVHPDLEIETARARALLGDTV